MSLIILYALVKINSFVVCVEYEDVIAALTVVLEIVVGTEPSPTSRLQVYIR